MWSWEVAKAVAVLVVAVLVVAVLVVAVLVVAVAVLALAVLACMMGVTGKATEIMSVLEAMQAMREM